MTIRARESHRVARLLRLVPFVVAAGVGSLTANAAYAHGCDPSYVQWSQAAGTGIASIPTHDTCFPAAPGRSRAYFNQGTEMFTVYNQNFPAGCTPGTGNLCAPTGGTCTRLKGCRLDPWTASPPVTLSGFPNAVPSSRDANRAYVFLGADNGRLYRIDISGEPPYPTLSVDTRRPSCSSDRVIATPAVQLYSSSNQAFKSRVDSFGGTHIQDDVVFVVTSTGCGGSSGPNGSGRPPCR